MRSAAGFFLLGGAANQGATQRFQQSAKPFELSTERCLVLALHAQREGAVTARKVQATRFEGAGTPSGMSCVASQHHRRWGLEGRTRPHRQMTLG